jgi:hypothetical protein
MLKEKEASWSPEQAWTVWREEKSLAPAGNRIPDHPVHSFLVYLLRVGKYDDMKS